MKKVKSVYELLELHDIIFKQEAFDSIIVKGDTIEFLLSKEVSLIRDEIKKSGIEIEESGTRTFEVSLDRSVILLFVNKEDFYDKVCTNNLKIEGMNLFIWSLEDSCALYENFNYDEAKIKPNKFGNFLLNIIQYRLLLNVFLDELNQVIEFERPKSPDNEIFITSKGDEKLLVKLSYKKIAKGLYPKKYEELPIEKFKERMRNNEWLVCFRNTVCSFFDKQSESKKNFIWLYENFQYLFANTEKSYYLYINKFSFEKISNQFRRDKDLYFGNLNDLQSKLGSQLISIPLTVGAALLTENFVAENGVVKGYVSFAISCYLFFVIGSIVVILLDLNKQKQDVRGERKSLKSHYSDLYADFKKDFEFLVLKTRYLFWLGILIILLFLLVLLLVWFPEFMEILYYVLFC